MKWHTSFHLPLTGWGKYDINITVIFAAWTATYQTLILKSSQQSRKRSRINTQPLYKLLLCARFAQFPKLGKNTPARETMPDFGFKCRHPRSISLPWLLQNGKPFQFLVHVSSTGKGTCLIFPDSFIGGTRLINHKAPIAAPTGRMRLT